MDTCICTAESLRYALEIITVLLINYTPTQKNKVKNESPVTKTHQESPAVKQINLNLAA